MEVSGVRMSWDTARRRLALIFSFSDSSRSFSWFLIWVVRALTLNATASITRKVRGYPVMVKLKAK